MKDGKINNKIAETINHAECLSLMFPFSTQNDLMPSTKFLHTTDLALCRYVMEFREILLYTMCS